MKTVLLTLVGLTISFFSLTAFANILNTPELTCSISLVCSPRVTLTCSAKGERAICLPWNMKSKHVATIKDIISEESDKTQYQSNTSDKPLLSDSIRCTSEIRSGLQKVMLCWCSYGCVDQGTDNYMKREEERDQSARPPQ